MKKWFALFLLSIFVSSNLNAQIIQLGAGAAAASGINAVTSEMYLGAGAWQANGSAKAELYLTPSFLFGKSITINDLSSIDWFTNKTVNGVNAVDWYVNIYTNPYLGGDASWYGNRLTLEPLYSNNLTALSAPANQWNRWSTDAGSNQLTLFDGNHGPIGFFGAPTLSDVQAGSIKWNDYTPTGDTTPIDYASQTIQFIVLATGNPWANGFTGFVDALSIGLKGGENVTLDLEAVPGFVVPEPSTVMLLGFGLFFIGLFRRIKGK